MIILFHTSHIPINHQYRGDCWISYKGGSMKKQPERTAMTRGTLIDTFIKLSENKPINKISVSEICNVAGYNRSTFYQYFTDTHHLLSCIEDDLLLYIKNTVISQIGERHPENLFVDLFIEVNTEKKNTLKLLLDKSLNNGFPTKLKESLIPLFAAQMNLSLDDEQTIYKLDFYLSGIISVLSRWVTSDTPMPPEKYGLIVQQLVEGMRKSGIFPSL